MIQVEGVDCGIAGCEWKVRFPIADRGELCAGAVSECYELFWKHCVLDHGLNPDEVPSMKSAGFAIRLSQGRLRVEAVMEEIKTWGEFKRWVESNGVKDDMEINYIDVSTDFGDGPSEVVIEKGRKKFSVV